MNTCEAEHGRHDRIIVEARPYGSKKYSMEVYDYEKYRDTVGYCTGDDVVSRSISESGMWEGWDTKALLSHDVFSGGVVLDVGSHIGWYSLLAAYRGCEVYAFEGDSENAEVLRNNVSLNHLDKRVSVFETWVGEGWTPDINFDRVDLIKIDIEGKDAFAVEAFRSLIDDRKVNHLLVEISPVFGEGYPQLVESICRAGYEALVLCQDSFPLPSYEWVNDCHQVDILFSRS